MTITEFLTARYDEDEAIARGADGELEPWTLTDSGNVTAYDKQLIASVWIQNARHIAHFDPARILADIATKRAIVELHDGSPTYGCGSCTDMDYLGLLSPEDTDYPCDTLKALAQPYAGHADFDEEWRVSQVA